LPRLYRAHESRQTRREAGIQFTVDDGHSTLVVLDYVKRQPFPESIEGEVRARRAGDVAVEVRRWLPSDRSRLGALESAWV
jgi:hypothetical protein